jgi:glycerol-3-phosphate O-acyltransferase
LKNKVYPHIIPDITKWPIYQFGKERELFVNELRNYVNTILLQKYGDRLKHVIRRTAYQERMRVKNQPWKADPSSDRLFWKRVHDAVQNLPETDEPTPEGIALLDKIVHRYCQEIVGNFKLKTFLFARKFLTAFFGRMLNAAKGRIFGGKRRLYEKLIVNGEVKKVRHLFSKGSVVVLPTHFSNLDSILIGYAMDSIMGLPSFTYGAGLNLYDSEIIGYFMNRLGAYRVDRRKKNPIYIEALKSMSGLSIQKGVNSLFFPGGTRSRSGALEEELKQGLLNSLVEAQRKIYEEGGDLKIFVVPMIINYHFVLEADHLISQHLNSIGKERFVHVKDDFKSTRKILTFIWRIFSQKSEIYLSVGHPIDVMGNILNNEGDSLDSKGKKIDLKDYFKSDGKITLNEQRERVYTKLLADSVVHSFKKYNIVLSSNIVAFCAFEMLKESYPELDILGLIKLPEDDFIFNREKLLAVIEQVRIRVMRLQEKGSLMTSIEPSHNNEDILREGLNNLGVYHASKPLKINQDKKIVSESFKTLYYYHNRLTGYELDHKIDWEQV